MTHTPGPWRQNAHYWVRQQSGLAICELFGTIEQSRANGALIAAAPDMLAALKAALAVLVSVHVEECMDENDNRTYEEIANGLGDTTVMAQVRAAIAKAEGGHE